jgi:ABC-2 type transport system ATP-binding protein
MFGCNRNGVENMIVVDNITKNFGSFEAVKGVSFSVKDGQIFGIVGPNGAGKSTIVRMLATILKPSSGNASVMGLDITKNAEKVRRLIGYLPEEPRVYDYMSGKEYLELFAQLYDNNKYDIGELVKFVGLEKHIDRKIGEYSKGLRQRLSIARSLVNDPKLLILDEPTMGLDPASARDLREKVLEMRDAGRTVLMCTHYMDEADFLCDELVILNNGQVAAQGIPEKLKASLGGEVALRIVLEEENEQFVKALKAKKKGRSIIVPISTINSGAEKVCEIAKKTNAKILSIDTVSSTLEDVFVKATRKGSL